MSDIDRLRAELSLSVVAIDCGVDLQKNGREFEGCCPFHQENTPSFTIFTGKDGIERFHCFGCNERGDLIDFVKLIKGVDTKGAIDILGGGRSVANVAPRRIAEPRDPYAGIELLVPRTGIAVGRSVRLYNPKRADDPARAWGDFTATMVFPYHHPDGQPLGYVLRRNIGDGKETPMVCWVRLPDGTECWSRFPLPRPRPLYRVEKLRDGQVIVVEGEKCADAVVAASGRQAVSWAGGTHGVDHADWLPLAGRSVVIWPDADEPGLATAEKIAATLAGIGCTVKIARVEVAV